MNPKYPHLISGMLAFLFTLGTLFTGTAYAQSLEQKYIHALAPLILSESKIGTALQQTAFQQPDLLVIYGSSELLTEDTPELLQYGRSTKIPVEATPYGASQFFQYYPTGFKVYFVANEAMSSLNFAQNLAGEPTHARQLNELGHALILCAGLFQASFHILDLLLGKL